MAARLIIRKIYEWNTTAKPDQYAYEDDSCGRFLYTNIENLLDKY